MLSTKVTSSLQLEHPSVQKVIKIAEEIIEENKVLHMEIIYNRAKRALKLPRKGLLQIIQFLFNRKILIDGSRHTSTTILNNIYRRKIYEMIHVNNGATFSLLRGKAFPVQSGSSGQFLWHLKMLLKFNLIKKIKVGKFSLFLPIHMDDDIGTLYFFLNDPSYEEIIDLVLQSKKIKKADIHKHIEDVRELVYRRIEKLVKNNILTEIEDVNKELSISPRIKKFLQESIPINIQT